MTREEASAILEESKRQNEIMRDNPSTFWASQQMAEGVKNAKRRIAALDFALTALRPVSRERVEKIRGEWIEEDDDLYCSRCGHIIPDCAGNATPIYKSENKFCYYCGAPMTDEAVDILLKRLEALKDGKGD